MTRAWFVTGTDTGVGKTRASAALLHALRARHARCVGMKPVAAGTDATGVNEDVLALRAAGNVAVPPELDNPVALPDAGVAAHRRRARRPRGSSSTRSWPPTGNWRAAPMPWWSRAPAASWCRCRPTRPVPTWPRPSACR